MAKRHQGKQKPTYKYLKAQGKVMTQAGEIVTLKNRVPGRGGGKQGVSGDRHVWGRDIEGDKTKNRKKVSAKKTAKRRGPQKAKSTTQGATGFTKRLKRAQAVHKRRVPKARTKVVKKSKGYA